MKKEVLAISLVLSTLSGCGSGSSNGTKGSNSGQTYNWQIIHLETKAAENVEDDCIIFSSLESDNSKVITASVANTNYNILFHDPDGVILDEYTIAAEDVSDDGIVSIDSSLIQDSGYISLEEVENGLSNNPNIYMFSVEKSLLSDLIINVRLPQTGSDCYIGEDYRATNETSDTAAISVLEEANVNYYLTSYSETLVSGKNISSNISVLSPIPAEHDTLVTAYNLNENNEYTNLSYYAFVAPSYVYDKSQVTEVISAGLGNNNLTPFYWQKTDTLTLNPNSSINIIHDGNSYLWQYIYNDTDQVTLAIDDSEISQWTSFFSGTENNTQWQFDSFLTVNNSTSEIELNVPELSSVEEMHLIENCEVEDNSADYCIDADSSFTPDDFTIQRTHVRLLSGSDNNTVYQTVYGLPSLKQPLLESSRIDIQPSSTSRIEIALIDGIKNDNNFKYFMSKYLDIDTIAETRIANNFNDTNGYVTNKLEDEALYQSTLKSNITFVQHSIE